MVAFGLLFAAAGYTAVRASFGEALPPATEGLVVQYKPGVDSDELKPTYDDHAAVETGEIEQLNTDVIKVPPTEQADIVKELKADPRVKSVEPDYTVKIDTTKPNDTYYSKQYNWPIMSVDQLWDTTKGSSSITIAVIDSGVRATHEDLASHIVPGYDFQNDDNNPDDDNGHGTAVSGVIAATGNNGVGVAGGCWNCKIMPLKAVGPDGTGKTSGFAEAITYAVDHGAKLINMSVSGADDSSVEKSAVDYAASKNVQIIAASGNYMSDVPRFPASYPSVISVAGSTADDSILGESNFGPTVDVAAPGDAIATTYWKADNQYNSWTGTSFSTPAITALAALLISKFPTATVADIRDAIVKNTDPCCSNKFPGGRANAMKASAYLATKYTPVTPTPTPTPTPPSPTPTPTPTPPSPAPKTGDLNNDGKVNLTDLSTLLSNWNKNYSAGDYNKNGKVDLPDLSVLLSNWNK